MKRLFLYLLFSCLLNSCGYSQQRKEPQWVIEGREAFNKQEHRLEFKGCEITYNGKNILLNKPIDEFINVLGKNYRVDNKYNNRLIWDEIGIVANGKESYPLPSISQDSISLFTVFFKFSQKDKEDDESLVSRYPKNRNNIILVEGIPVQKGSMLQEVLDASEILQSENYEGVFTEKIIAFTDCEAHNSKYLKYIFDYPNYLSLGVENEGYIKEGEILSFKIFATDSGLK